MTCAACNSALPPEEEGGELPEGEEGAEGEAPAEGAEGAEGEAPAEGGEPAPE